MERLNSLKEVEITLGESTLLLGQVSAGEKETILSLNDQLAGEYKGALLVHFKKYLLPEISQTKNFFKEEFEKFEDILKQIQKILISPCNVLRTVLLIRLKAYTMSYWNSKTRPFYRPLVLILNIVL